MIKLKIHSPPLATPLNINIITLNMFFEDSCFGQVQLKHLEATETISYLTCTSQPLWNVTPDAGCLSFMEQLADPNCFKLALRKRDLRINKLQLSYIQMCIIRMKTVWWLLRSNDNGGGLEFVKTHCQSSHYQEKCSFPPSGQCAGLHIGVCFWWILSGSELMRVHYLLWWWYVFFIRFIKAEATVFMPLNADVLGRAK